MAAPAYTINARKDLSTQAGCQVSSVPSSSCAREPLACATSVFSGGKPCSEPPSCYHHHHHHHHHHLPHRALGGPCPVHFGTPKSPKKHSGLAVTLSAPAEHLNKGISCRGAQHSNPSKHGGASVPHSSETGNLRSPSQKKLPQEQFSKPPERSASTNIIGTENAPIVKKVAPGGKKDGASNPCDQSTCNMVTADCSSKPSRIQENNSPGPPVIDNGVKQVAVNNQLPSTPDSCVKLSQQEENSSHKMSGPSVCETESSKEANCQSQTDSGVDCTSNYGTASDSMHDSDQVVEADTVNDDPGAAKVGDGVSSAENASVSAKASDSHAEFVESGKSSICRGSNSSDVSDESSCSSLSSSINKPHKANDTRWEAIQTVRAHEGVLGLGHFRLLKRLGCGDIGSVYLSELCGTRSYFAMKVMDKAALANRKKLLRAQTEREILQSLDHPFLPTLYTHFETDTFSCLVMEFCPGGDLHTLRQRQPGKYFHEHAARFYVAEVLLALEYLHMLGIIYRDLKPENVLVREDGHIMLSDFDLSLRCAVSPTLVKANSDADSSNKNPGYCVQPACMEPSCVIQPSCVQPTCFTPRFLSGRIKKEKKTKPKPRTDVGNQVSPLPELIAEPTSARSMSFVGTHEYLAPEIIKGEGHGSAVDWWTFGIFLYELLFGKTPFKGSGNRATLFNVVGQPLRFPESPTVSFAARDLIRGLLVKEPQHRLAYRRGATEVKQHPFFQSVNWALIRCASPPDIPRPFEMDLPPRVQAPSAISSEKKNVPGVDVKPSGDYLEIDFF